MQTKQADVLLFATRIFDAGFRARQVEVGTQKDGEALHISTNTDEPDNEFRHVDLGRGCPYQHGRCNRVSVLSMLKGNGAVGPAQQLCAQLLSTLEYSREQRAGQCFTATGHRTGRELNEWWGPGSGLSALNHGWTTTR